MPAADTSRCAGVDDPVFHWIVVVNLPPKKLSIELFEFALRPAHDFEMNDWCSHWQSSPVLDGVETARLSRGR